MKVYLRFFLKKWIVGLNTVIPNRDFIVRTDGRVSFLKLTPNLQVFGLIALFGLSGWFMFASVSYIVKDEVIKAKEIEIVKNRIIYRALLSEVSEYQGKFSSLMSDMEKSHTLMLSLVGKNAALKQNLVSAENKLVSSKLRHKAISNARNKLTEELSGIQNRMRDLSNHNFQLKGSLSSVAGDLDNAVQERNLAVEKNEKLEVKVKKLTNQISELYNSEIDLLSRLTKLTEKDINSLEHAVFLTGIFTSNKKNINKNIVAFNNLPGIKPAFNQGGPFVALGNSVEYGKLLSHELKYLNRNMKKLESLRKLVDEMPLSAPLDYFSISSHYGKRRDPINKRWAMHYGTDFVGEKNANVYSVSKGKVKRAGYFGKYGNYIEIEHASGFTTRYGHLSKILVKKGQPVSFRQRIGLMGNTGRSTGNHLHYEIVYKGRNKNPWKFIKAGKFVYKK